ncbi:MAG: carbohydrate binding domain-containing protein, partial [Planctomycetota bacterium]
TDQKLRNIWSEGAEELGKNILANSNFQTIEAGRNVPKNWNLEQHSGCKASLSRTRYKGKDTLRIDISKADDTEWHLQLNQGGLAVKSGKYYTVTFDAAVEKSRKIGCTASQAHNPWNNLGLSRQVALKNEWHNFRYGFVAKANDENTRISFSFGGSDIPLYLANVEFRPGGRVGLEKGESIKAGTVAVFADSESPVRILDRMRFLAETEKAYFDDMRNFIKKDLGCKALVTGTIVFGPLGLYAQSDMDFIDAHAYWQHPRFPGRPWDSGNWLIEQKPMTDYPTQATLFRLAAERLNGKPFTVSEYNHPAPLDSQAECVPMIASFAAAQDWDGVWLYTYSHSSDGWYRENMYSYFDIDTNPAKWGFMRAGAAIFRDTNIVAQSAWACVVLPLADSSDVVGPLSKLHLEHDRDMFAVLAKRFSITREKMLDTQFAAAFGNESFVRVLYSSHPKLGWSVENGKGIYTGRGQRASVYTGHAARFAESAEGKISIVRPDFVVVTVTALDKEPLDQSEKILITACGRCENTGMKFSEDRRTVGRNWGQPPVQIEPVEGTLVLKGNWTCQALGPDGMPKRRVAVPSEEMQSHITLSPQYETMWYLLTRRIKPD